MRNMKNKLIEDLAKKVMNIGEKAATTYSIGSYFYEPKIPTLLLIKEK